MRAHISPIMNKYYFLPKYKTVIDETEFIVYTASEFERKIKADVAEEEAFIKKRVNDEREARYAGDYILSGYYEGSIEVANERLGNLKRLLNRLKVPKKGREELNIQAAKQVPIPDFLEFNRADFRRCIFHEEKSPSMKYYRKENRVHCFGCGKGGDVIDVVMHINNLSLSDAVKQILNV